MKEDLLPVLVVGAGPVGLTMACELARRGVPCRIIDRCAGPTPLHESRALVVWERTLEVFRDMGVVERVFERGKKIRGIHMFAAGHEVLRLGLELEDDLETRYRFPLSLPQGETERILEARLVGLGGRVERETRLIALAHDADGVTATVVGPDYKVEEVRARWLVGCDGAGSSVRKLLLIPFGGAEYADPFFLADVSLTWDAPEDEAMVFLQPEGGAVAAFPLPRQGQWRLIDATGKPEPEDLAGISMRFRSVLQETGHGSGVITEVFWTSSFHIHRRIADHFRSKRCFLAGDAAHIHSPLGGQGMNTGIQDAYNLAWKLALVVSENSGEGLLDSYEAERRPVALSVLRATDLATRGIMFHGHGAEAVRGRAIGFLGRRKKVLVRIRRGLSEIDVSYKGSPVVGGDVPTGRVPAPGGRLPDVVVRKVGETQVWLLDLLRGDRHHLLLFAGTSEDEDDIAPLRRLVKLIQEKYPATVSVRCVVHPEAEVVPLEAAGAIYDETGSVYRCFGFESPSLLLVRPDGYIGFRQEGPREAFILDHLKRVLPGAG